MTNEEHIAEARYALSVAIRTYLRGGNGAVGQRTLALEVDGELPLDIERKLCDSLERVVVNLFRCDPHWDWDRYGFDGLLPVQIVVGTPDEVSITGAVYVFDGPTLFLALIDATIRLQPDTDQLAEYTIRFMPADDFRLKTGDWSKVTRRTSTSDQWRDSAQWRFQFRSGPT